MSDEAKFLRAYRPDDWPRPAVAVDLVVLTIVDADVKVLLVRRRGHPFQGWWALPGGFVRVSDGPDQGESVDAAAARELEEETGLRGAFLEQLYTFGDPGRDPRMRVISVAYYALVRPDLPLVAQATGDAADPRWFSVRELPELAFDHRRIVDVAVGRLRGKLDYTPVGFELVPPTFTVAELRGVYEAVMGTAYDPANFRRRFKRMLEDGTIEEAPGKRHTPTKPAKVYRFVRR